MPFFILIAHFYSYTVADGAYKKLNGNLKDPRAVSIISNLQTARVNRGFAPSQTLNEQLRQAKFYRVNPKAKPRKTSLLAKLCGVNKPCTTSTVPKANPMALKPPGLTSKDIDNIYKDYPVGSVTQ